MENFPYLLNTVVGLAGFLLAAFMWNKKRQRKEFTCPLKGKCHEVINSDYSKIFGIAVEKLGMLYYALIIVGYSLLVMELLEFSLLNQSLLVATGLAFLFSMYLTYIQFFVLKKICTWCLVSASFCTVLFGSSLYAFGLILNLPKI